MIEYLMIKMKNNFAVFKCEPYYLKSDEILITLKYKNKYFMYITTMNSMTKTYFCSFFHANLHVHIYIYMYILIYAPMVPYTYIYLYIYTCMHHTCTHTSIHTHIE